MFELAVTRLDRLDFLTHATEGPLSLVAATRGQQYRPGPIRISILDSGCRGCDEVSAVVTHNIRGPVAPAE
jgi:hypothetical protein